MKDDNWREELVSSMYESMAYSMDVLTGKVKHEFKIHGGALPRYKSKPNPMKASEAKKIADENKLSLAEVFERIKGSASNGNYMTVFDKRELSYHHIDDLKSFGYVVDIDHHGRYTIIWE